MWSGDRRQTLEDCHLASTNPDFCSPHLRSSSLLFITFRATPSPKGQQMVPVSCWTLLEPTRASLAAPNSFPGPSVWGKLQVWLTKFLIKGRRRLD